MKVGSRVKVITRCGEETYSELGVVVDVFDYIRGHQAVYAIDILDRDAPKTLIYRYKKDLALLKFKVIRKPEINERHTLGR